MMVKGLFDTPILSVQVSWDARGLSRGVLSDDQQVKFNSVIEVEPSTERVIRVLGDDLSIGELNHGGTTNA